MNVKRLIKLVSSVLVAVSISFSFPAHAGCKQKNIKGTWEAQGFFVDDVSGYGYWLSCKLKLNSKGFYDPFTSVCIYDTGVVVYPGGRLQVKGNCLLNDSLIDLWDSDGFYIGASTLQYGTVDKGQTVIQSVGDGGTSLPFILNAVKR